MTHPFVNDGRHDHEEERPSRLPGSRAQWRQLLYNEKIVMTVLVAIFTTILGWLVAIGLETRDKMFDIVAKINLHTEQIARQDQRISVQEGNSLSIPLITDRVKAQEERLQEHTRAIITAEGVLHELERGIGDLRVREAENRANTERVGARLNEIYDVIKQHSAATRKK